SRGAVAPRHHPRPRAQPDELEGASPFGGQSKPVVRVLVDEQHSEVALRLGVQRIEESLQLRDAVHRGNDQVEGRKPFRRHAPYANRPCRSFPSSSPCTTTPASSATDRKRVV